MFELSACDLGRRALGLRGEIFPGNIYLHSGGIIAIDVKYFRLLAIATVVSGMALAAGISRVDNAGAKNGASANTDFSFGSPHSPDASWSIAAGGRLYDKWWSALDKPEPKGNHPAYPASGQAKGSVTFRCKECHGWDYRGKDGGYGTGSHATGIVGINGAAGKSPDAIAKMLRSAPHNYTPAMLPDPALANLAAFVSLGQHDTRKWIGKDGKSLGVQARGKAVFQTVCAACHGYDGRLLNWGSEKAPEYIGTAATKFPEEFFHKLRNGHPGSIMINLRAFDLQTSADVHAYSQTLPVK